MSQENVRNKLYPKSGKFELGAINSGKILNQSYVDSYILETNINYFFNETWGIGLEALFSLNSDTEERYCIENFFNDPLNKLSSPCPQSGENPATYLATVKEANVGPAYVPIREINSMMHLNLLWNPIYGKMLLFHKTTLYFDTFFSLGAGLAFSTFYPGSLTLRDGRKARGDFTKKIPDNVPCPSGDGFPGVCPNEAGFESLVGVAGRPNSESLMNPSFAIGVGQKVHFLKNFQLKFEVKNYTVYDSVNGVGIFFVVLGGVGARF